MQTPLYQNFLQSTGLDSATGIRQLDGSWRTAQPSRITFRASLGGFRGIRLQKIQAPESELSTYEALCSAHGGVSSVLQGMAASHQPIAYGISVRQGTASIWYASPDSDLLAQLLQAQIYGSQLGMFDLNDLAAELDDSNTCMVFTGIPAEWKEERIKVPETENADRLLRGLIYSTDFDFVVIAHPWQSADSEQLVTHWGAELRNIESHLRLPNTAGMQDRPASYYLEQLERQFQRALVGRAEGNWFVQTFLCAANTRPGAAAASVFIQPHAQPEPVRARAVLNNESYDHTADQLTWICSQELAVWIQPPLREFPGYEVHRGARFDICPPPQPSDGTSVQIGWVQDLNSPTGQALEIPLNDLTAHTLIAGTTNSGKTNSSFHLLRQLQDQKVHFLVIEPAKGEYRHLSGVHTYTLGTPESPLYLNPFEVPKGVSVQMHLDYLLSLFSASFVLYAPMPYVLESALVEVYTDRGWDLWANRSWRDPHQHPRAFPTLTDLYHKVGEVTDRLGYDQRLNADVKAALRTRINSLRLGTKGRMLDTRRPLDFGALMSEDVVIEMGSIGSEEQKAFLMGLLLTRLYEHHLPAGPQISKTELRHVTVIEEAHRLLENTSSQQGGDFANPKGKAVQTFANLITEIRAYGEGLVIVEQSPVKLVPDVIKNTNLKIIHRIISGDDREQLARVMNLSEPMQEQLVSMERGSALAFTSGMDYPLQLSMVAAKGVSSQKPLATSEPTPQPSLTGLAEDAKLKLDWLRWLFSELADMGAKEVQDRRTHLEQVIVETLPMGSERQDLVARTISQLSDSEAVRFGHMYTWDFNKEQDFFEAVNVLWTTPTANLRETLRESLRINEKHLPFEGCRACEQPCLFRPFLTPLLGSPVLRDTVESAFSSLRNLHETPGSDFLRVELSVMVAEYADSPPNTVRGMMRCALLQLLGDARLPNSRRVEFVDVILGPPERTRQHE